MCSCNILLKTHLLWRGCDTSMCCFCLTHVWHRKFSFASLKCAIRSDIRVNESIIKLLGKKNYPYSFVGFLQ